MGMRRKIAEVETQRAFASWTFEIRSKRLSFQIHFNSLQNIIPDLQVVFPPRIFCILSEPHLWIVLVKK